jgi:hypothetical protein
MKFNIIQKMFYSRLIKMLDQYFVQAIALHALDDRHLVRFLRGQHGWRVDCEDEMIILFTRASPVL